MSNTSICTTGLGRKRTTAPDKITIPGDAICQQLGLQQGTCNFVELLFVFWETPFSQIDLDISIWGDNNLPKSRLASLTLASKIYEYLEKIWEINTIVDGVRPDEISTFDLCSIAPDSAAYGDADSYYAAIFTALATKNFEPLFALILTDYFSVLWLENCECVPDDSDQIPPVYPTQPPFFATNCSGGANNYDDFVLWVQDINSANQANRNAIQLTNDIVTFYPSEYDGKGARFFYDLPNPDYVGGSINRVDGQFLMRRFELRTYGTGIYGNCECNQWFFGFYIRLRGIDRIGNGGAIYDFFVITRGRPNIKKCAIYKSYRDFCRDFPDQCGCKKVIKTVSITNDCNEFENIDVEVIIENVPNGCDRIPFTVPTGQPNSCLPMAKEVYDLKLPD